MSPVTVDGAKPRTAGKDTTTVARGKRTTGACTGAVKTTTRTTKKQAVALVQQRLHEKELAVAEAAAAEKVRAETTAEHRHACLGLELLKDDLEFLLLDVGAKEVDVAAVFRLNKKSIASLRQRSERSRQQETEEERAARAKCIRKRFDSLLTTIGLRSQTFFEVLMFPAPKETRSKTHLDRILTLLRSALHPLHVSIYVLSHEEVADALIEMALSQWGVSVTVLVAYTVMFCMDSRVYDLMVVGILVDVDASTMYTMHHKYVVVDERVTMHGSVSFYHHALVSAGIIAIHDDRGMVDPPVAGLGHLSDKTKCRRVLPAELSKSTACAQCEERAILDGAAP
ncbi:hypothetical protein Gpo141_00006970 [Globisporangium polare]